MRSALSPGVSRREGKRLHFQPSQPLGLGGRGQLGRGDRAMKFYDALLPENQNDMIERREAEPYSYCQFIMGRDHGLWPGAPSLYDRFRWMGILCRHPVSAGCRPDFDGLTVDPCIPGDWKSFRVVRKWRGAEYHILVENPDGKQKESFP